MPQQRNKENINRGGLRIIEIMCLKLILTTKHRGDQLGTLDIIYCEWKLHFCNACSNRGLKASWCVGKLTVEMVLPEDGENERRNASEY
jgi:hypothetical protein